MEDQFLKNNAKLTCNENWKIRIKFQFVFNENLKKFKEAKVSPWKVFAKISRLNERFKHLTFYTWIWEELIFFIKM